MGDVDRQPATATAAPAAPAPPIRPVGPEALATIIPRVLADLARRRQTGRSAAAGAAPGGSRR